MALRKCQLTLFCTLNDIFVPPKTIGTNKSSCYGSQGWCFAEEISSFHCSLIRKSQAILGLPNRYFPKRTVGCPWKRVSEPWNYWQQRLGVNSTHCTKQSLKYLSKYLCINDSDISFESFDSFSCHANKGPSILTTSSSLSHVFFQECPVRWIES